MTLLQEVTLHRVADRHRDLHGRDFASTTKATVDQSAVLEALALLGHPAVEPGSYSITVDWPHEGERL